MRRLSGFLGALFLLTAAARGGDDGLKPIADALAAVRAAHATNETRDAGPELTPVKQQLRAWVEAQLSSFPQDGDEAQLTRRLNGALKTADVTCDDGHPDGPRCNEKIPTEDATQFDARGYVGGVQLSRGDFLRYLVLTTDVGVRCGFDESAYIYEWRDKRWQLLLQTEQDRYGEKEYAPQNFISIQISPAGVGWNEPAPHPPLVLTLGYSPWCQSNWRMLYTRLWRASPSNSTPDPLIDSSDELYIGGDLVAAASVTQDDVLIQFSGGSFDGDALVRPVVRHYLVHDGDKLERIAPIALDPMDFVDEWLTNKWQDSARWTDSAADASALEKWHRALHKDHLFGQPDEQPKRCRADPTLWQVGFAFDEGEDKNFHADPPIYYLIRWMAPYRFTLVEIQNQKYPNCDVEDPMPDNLGTLFPLQDWRR